MPRSAREKNDSFPDLAQLPDPDTQVFVPPTDRRELMKLQYNTMKQQIHLVADKPQDEAQALARLQAFVARRQSDEDNDSEAERVEQKTSAAQAEADALTAMLNPPFCGSDWIEVDASESEVQESQPQRVPGGHKRRRATARARMTQAADQPDTGLGYLCAKFVEPALDHLRFQTQQKRSTEVIMDPVMTRAQREARLHRPESETRIGWIQNMLDNMDNFFPRDKPRTTVQRQCHYWCVRKGEGARLLCSDSTLMRVCVVAGIRRRCSPGSLGCSGTSSRRGCCGVTSWSGCGHGCRC